MTATLLRFSIVGVAAAVVHWTVVSLIVPIGVVPLIANVGGFLTAFSVSFAGHHLWSFPSQGRSRIRAMRRFFCVAVTAFCVNETAYWALLKFTELDYRVALVIVLGGVAAGTFIASRHWAFHDVAA